MRTKSISMFFGLAAAGCGWPFGTDATCAERGNCAGNIQPDAATGGVSGGSTGGKSGGGTGGAGGTSGTGGSGGVGGITDGGQDADADAPPACDTTASPSVAACVIDDAYGIFVSPTGSDANDGSHQHPFASLAQALSAVTATKRRIYACADGGSYAETLQNNASLDGISFYGGFHCKDWTYDTTLKAQLASPSPTAWRVTGLTKGLTVEDFVITAADATGSGASSIAMVVSQSENVVIRRVTIKAGNGADGDGGVKGTAGAPGESAESSHPGADAVCGASAPTQQFGGAWGGPNACGSQGGNGGGSSKSADGAAGNAGTPNTDVTPADAGKAGPGQSVLGQNGSAGGDGANGNDGSHGTASPVLGSFTASGYAPADGSDGTDGYPGQGGGGGGASKGDTNCVGASGGAGGMGGCGGGHGSAGKGGGASVALVVWQSAVTLESVALIAANGGAGGKGGNAGTGGVYGDGAPGGLPNVGGGIGGGGHGGIGGNGGNGGPGSGGTGGPSYALVYSGTLPIETAVSRSNGLRGTKGVGGVVEGTTNMNKAPDGSDGQAAPELEIPGSDL